MSDQTPETVTIEVQADQELLDQLYLACNQELCENHDERDFHDRRNQVLRHVMSQAYQAKRELDDQAGE